MRKISQFFPLEIIEVYEQEFTNLVQEIQHNLETIPDLRGQQQRVAIRAVHSQLKEAQTDILEQIEVSISGLSPSDKKQTKLKLNRFKEQYKQLQSDIRKIESIASREETDRIELFEGVDGDGIGDSATQREHLAKETESKREQTEKLKQGHRQALEAETMGEGIMQNLEQQRRTIRNSGMRLSEADSNVTTTDRILTSMVARLATNKIILWMIILAIIGVVCYLVYYIFSK